VRGAQILYASQGEEFDAASTFNVYKQLQVLGEGGFGRVILGEHRRTREKVAIKFLNTAQIGNAYDIDMVFKEADVLKSL
jgi:MAP/microtubule affinity-regulating kinase